MAFVRSVKRHAWTLYWSAIAAVGSSVVVVATLLMPGVSSPVAGRLPGPVVTVTVGPSVPAPKPSASASASAGAVGVHHAPTPRIVLVGTTPSIGLPPSSAVSPPGPTVLPTPSASGSATPILHPSRSPSPTVVSVAVAAHVLGARVVAKVALPLVSPSAHR